MRLLILTPEFEAAGGGIATFYRSLVPALAARGVSVRVIEGSAVHAGESSPRQVGGAHVETLELARLERWAMRFPAFAAAPTLRRHLAASWAMWEQAGFGAGCDVVEAADWGLPFAAPAVEGAPLLIQAHASAGQVAARDPIDGEATQDALIRLIESALLARARRVQTYSRANADFWRAETGRPVDMIRPALAPAAPLPAATPSDRGLVVGRLQAWKGPHTLCRALALMGAGAPRIDWVGRDMPLGRRDRPVSADLAARFPDIWGDRLALSPPRPAADIAGLQAAARFNLVPSDWDVFNFTVAEAMASGRPTIVSSGAGASELVTEGDNGFVFAAGDPAALAGAIERLMAAPPARLARIAAAARDTVERELDPARIADQRLAAYVEAAGPAPTVGGWLGELCRPGAGPGAEDAFLAQFPARAMAGHLAARLGRKLGVSAARRGRRS